MWHIAAAALAILVATVLAAVVARNLFTIRLAAALWIAGFTFLVALCATTFIGLRTRRCELCGSRIRCYSDIVRMSESDVFESDGCRWIRGLNVKRQDLAAYILECPRCAQYTYVCVGSG